MNRFLIILLLFVGLGTGVGLAARNVIQERRERNAQVAQEKKADISVTIIEGKRREEIAAQLAAAGVVNYDDFLAVSGSVEGELFPNTYRFFPNTPATDVLKKFTDSYEANIGDLGATNDQLILGSIVERESLNDADRATIAGVYANRIEAGMTLGADPTVEYAKDTLAFAKNPSADFTFWGPITRADYQNVKSPFNTYLQTGLPPAPICNPGVKSVQAAMAPAQHSYLYFKYRDGKLLLSKTLAEHESK